MTTATKTLRAAVYCRISRDAEQEGLGVARQEEDCRKLASREGFTVTNVYVDRLGHVPR
jgi:DNA invertase Pin-like site-specific DNA recombinase